MSPKREAHLRSILDTRPDAMIVIGDKDIVGPLSAAAERLFGYDRGEMIGHNVKMLVPSPGREVRDVRDRPARSCRARRFAPALDLHQ